MLAIHTFADLHAVKAPTTLVPLVQWKSEVRERNFRGFPNGELFEASEAVEVSRTG